MEVSEKRVDTRWDKKTSETVGMTMLQPGPRRLSGVIGLRASATPGHLRPAPITALAFFLALLATGCQLGGAGATPTPQAKLAPAARPTAVVRRGAITDTVRIFGRVAAAREADLYFAKGGKLKKVAVQAGQEVREGQLLAELDLGDLPNRIAQAQSSLETAQIKLEEAKAKRGDEAAKRELELKTAELAVRQAEATLAKAEEDLAKARAEPSPVEAAKAKVRDAETTLEQARYNLVITQKSDAVSKTIRDREYEHNWYEVRYGETLRKLEEGSATQEDVDRDWRNLLGAKERLDSARANAALTLRRAEDDVVKAEDALKKARIELEVAQTQPPDKAAREAENAVAAARLALDKAKIELEAKRKGPGPDYELPLLEKAVEQARLTLEDLQSQQTNSRLVAPFDGKVTSVRYKLGDDVPAYQTVVSLADPRELLVRTELADADLAKVAPEQKATLTIDTQPGQALAGVVLSVPGSLVGQTGQVTDRSVRLKVEGLTPGTQLGMLVRGTIVVQQKEDALIVPTRAVKTAGKRKFVEYMDGAVRRAQNVEVGIVTDAEAEILSGLREGQVILAGR